MHGASPCRDAPLFSGLSESRRRGAFAGPPAGTGYPVRWSYSVLQPQLSFRMPSFPTDGPNLVTSERLPVLPLRDVVVFPFVVMPLLVGRAASLAALEAANEEDRLVLLVAQRDPETQEPAAADLYRVGVVARI